MSNLYGSQYQTLPMVAVQTMAANQQTFIFEKNDDAWTVVPNSEPVDPSKVTWVVTIYQNKWRNTAVTFWKEGKSRHMSTHNLPQQVRAQLMLMGHNVK